MRKVIVRVPFGSAFNADSDSSIKKHKTALWFSLGGTGVSIALSAWLFSVQNTSLTSGIVNLPAVIFASIFALFALCGIATIIKHIKRIKNLKKNKLISE